LKARISIPTHNDDQTDDEIGGRLPGVVPAWRNSNKIAGLSVQSGGFIVKRERRFGRERGPQELWLHSGSGEPFHLYALESDQDRQIASQRDLLHNPPRYRRSFGILPKYRHPEDNSRTEKKMQYQHYLLLAHSAVARD
jgi:hypothetical protein